MRHLQLHRAVLDKLSFIYFHRPEHSDLQPHIVSFWKLSEIDSSFIQKICQLSPFFIHPNSPGSLITIKQLTDWPHINLAMYIALFFLFHKSFTSWRNRIIRLLFSNKKFQSRLIDIYETQFTKHGGDLMAYNIQGVLFKRLKIKPKYFRLLSPNSVKPCLKL